MINYPDSNRKPIIILCLIMMIAVLSMADHATATETKTARAWTDTPSENRVINLDMALDLALQHNTDLQRVSVTNQSNALSVDSAQRQYHPSISVSGSSSSQWSESGMDDQGWSDPTRSASVRLSSSYTLFDGGVRSAELRSKEATLSAGTLSGQRSTETILWQVVSAYLDATSTRAKIDVQRENLMAQQELLDQVEAYYNSGKRPVADLYQQQAEVASAEYSLIAAVQDYELRKLSLIDIIGVSPGTDLELIECDTEQMKSELELAETVDDALQRARSNRTDYLAKQKELDSAVASIEAAQGGKWPSIGLSLDAGSSYNSTSLESFGDQFGSDNPYVSAGVSISLPIYDRHATQNSVTNARLQLRRIELERLDLETQMATDMRQAFLEFDTAQKQLISAQKQVVYAQQALDNYQQRYAVSASTLLEVIQARTRQITAQTDRINAETNLIKKQITIAYYQGEYMVSRGVGE